MVPNHLGAHLKELANMKAIITLETGYKTIIEFLTPPTA